MKKILSIVLIVCSMVMLGQGVWAQHTWNLDSGYEVDLDTAASGWIYDANGPSADCSPYENGYLNLRWSVGDTLWLQGTFDFRSRYSYVRVMSSAMDTILYNRGTVDLRLTDGYANVYYYHWEDTLGVNGSGLALQYGLTPTTCLSPLASLRVYSLRGTSVGVQWTPRSWLNPFLLSLDSGRDSVVINRSSCHLGGLQRLTSYHIDLVARPDSGNTGCVVGVDFATDTCDEPLNAFRQVDQGSDWVRLMWTTDYYEGPYYLTWNGRDTVFSGMDIVLPGLQPNSEYTVTLASVLDTSCAACIRQISAHTSCFRARVNGLLPLIGNASVTLTSDSADAYLWSTGETTRSITVSQAGYYWLVAYTNNNDGCTDTLHFGVSNVELDIDIDIPADLCAGDEMDVLVGMGQGAQVRVNNNEPATMADPTRIFLPDGVDCDPTSDHGCSYRSALDFTGFGNYQLMTDPNDVRYVMLNIEHSYVGDLYINITCPNGQNADILRFNEGSSACTSAIDNSHRGWVPGDNCTGCYLGEPIDENDVNLPCDSTALQNRAGTGWRYCWSNNYQNGYSYASGDALIYRANNYVVVPGVGSTMDSSDVAAGTNFYHPDQSFESLLGCPMNGQWYIEVIDGFGSDNGYIFGWELALNPERLQRNSYMPSVASAQLQGAYFQQLNDTVFHISVPTNLQHDTTVTYMVTITDEDGNTFDTTFTVSFHPQRVRSMTRRVVENALPVALYGQSFADEVENYEITVPMSDGCDSTIYLTLTVARNVATALDTALCADDMPVTWHGHTYTDTETRTVTLNTWEGADSVVTYTVTVIPNPTLTTSPDTVIELGDYAVLRVNGTADYYVWTDGDGNIVGSGNSLTVSPAEATRYYVTGYTSYTAGANLIVNGDFEQGNTGFTSDYILASNLYQEGRYGVGPNPHSFHVNFTGADHTTGSGNMYVANGAGSPNTVAWQQVVNVTPYSDYAFGAWLLDVVSYPSSAAVMQFSINGQQLGSPFHSVFGQGWLHFYEAWNSGNSTTATITILNQNTSQGGNDFALDDIFFGQLSGCSAQSSVLVVPQQHVTVDSTVCSSALPLTWDGHTYTSATTHVDTLVSAYGYDSIVTHNLTVVVSNSAVVNGARTLIGSSDTITLTAGAANSYRWSTGATTPSIRVNEQGEYWLWVDEGTMCPDSTHVNIHQMHPPLEVSVADTMCAGDMAPVVVGVGANANVRVAGCESTLSDAQRIFLPDGVDCDPMSDHGCSYRSELVFNGFGSNEVISSTNDIEYVMLNIEHSFIGDLYINITCPNGQNADILRFNGSGLSSCTSNIGMSHRGWQPGSNSAGAYLGAAYDYENSANKCDSMASGNQPGTGWRYCWTDNVSGDYAFGPDGGYVYRTANRTGNNLDSSNVAAKTNFFHPDESFGSLVGCPMNGTWYIEVIDGYSMDNGWIFGWELALNPDLLFTSSYDPNIVNASMAGAFSTRTGDTTFVIGAPDSLAADTTVTYVVTFTDSLGVSFDTSFVVTYLALPRGTVYDTVVENQLPVVRYGQSFAGDTSDVELRVPQTEGCDSVVTYNLHVIRNTYSALYDTVCPGDMPYSWLGWTFNYADSHQVILPNALGADSVVMLHLFMNQNTATVFNDTCVENDLPRTYLGMTAYGDVTGWMDTIANIVGCDSVVTWNLKVWHNDVSRQSQTICDGDLATFSWNGLTSSLQPIATGAWKPTQVDTLRFATHTTHGADSTAILALTVKPSYQQDVYQTICANQTFAFEGSVYATTGDYAHTLTTVGTPACDSVRTLHLTVLDTSRTDTTAVACDYFDWYGMHFTASANTLLMGQYTNAAGCDSTLALHLTVNYAHAATYYDTCVENSLPRTYLGITAYDDTVGAMDTTVTSLGCDSVVTYNLHVWHNVSVVLDTAICDDMLARFVWNGVSSTHVRYDGTVPGVTNPVIYDTLHAIIPTTHGADSLIEMHLTVYPTYYHEFYDTICEGDELQFEGMTLTETGDYTVGETGGCDSVRVMHLMVWPSYHFVENDTIWDGNSTVFQGDTLTTTGNYDYHYETEHGCDSNYRMQLVVMPLNERMVFDTICTGMSYTFRDTALTESGVYLDTVRGISYEAGDTVVVLNLTVLPKPEITLSLLDSACTPPHYTLQGVANAPYLTWYSMPDDEMLEGHEHDSIVQVNPGQEAYYYLIADYREEPYCSAMDSIRVLPMEPVEAIIDITPSFLTLDDRYFEARNRSKGNVRSHRWQLIYDGQVQWMNEEEELHETVPNYIDSACVALRVTSRTCADTDTVCIELRKEGLFVPNVFTPAGQDNNLFRVVGLSVTDFELWVYDRRGDIVFHSTDINEGWDGTKDGRNCPMAAYVWKVKYSDKVTPGGYHMETGTVTLVR